MAVKALMNEEYRKYFLDGRSVLMNLYLHGEVRMEIFVLMECPM